MNQKLVAVIIALLIISALLGGVVIGLSKATKAAPAIVAGLNTDTCTYKNLTSANASSTKGVGIRGGAGTLQSITIASSSPLVALGIRLYDGIATSTTDTTATSSGTLIGKIKTSAAEITFPLFTSFKKGLTIDVPPGFDGSLIVCTQ